MHQPTNSTIPQRQRTDSAPPMYQISTKSNHQRLSYRRFS